DLDTGTVKEKSLQQYVAENGFSRDFVEDYLIPMGAAIWSTPSANMMQFPAETFFRFFENHGLLHLNEMPQWQTVVGGSFSYVNAFLRQFKGKVETCAAVSRIGRKEDAVDITLDDGTILTFDKVIIATHADEALKLFERPSAEEQELLGAWRYNNNYTILHSDASVMPPNRRAWASWNYYRHDDQNQLAVTYHMNRLQGLQTSRDYFVTLNSPLPIEPARIIKEIHYTHPMYTFDAIKTQNRLPELNGKQNTFFCGSYFGFGFHEDAVKSGVAVAKSLGMEL
ncbi:NADP transhydrogenase subunit alpha, partial [bacterium]|nr:NADP transhydrogenase subunit alpha [bacterium]